MDTRTVVETALMYWGAQDVEMTTAFLAEDAVYNLLIDRTSLAFAGETRGREAIKAALFAILADWDYFKYEPVFVAAEGERAHAQVEFDYRHRPSGNHLTGSFRLVIEVRDGLIRRIDEYHDKAMVEAFVRLATARQDCT